MRRFFSSRALIYLVCFFLIERLSKTALIMPSDSTHRSVDQSIKDSCDVFTYNKQPSVMIDGMIYPRHVPLYQNTSINFPCLNRNRTNTKVKRILLWNSLNGAPVKNYLEELIFNHNSRAIFDLLRCPVNNCELTVNRSLANESDFVVFHLVNKINKFPKHKPSNQRWVCFLIIRTYL